MSETLYKKLSQATVYVLGNQAGSLLLTLTIIDNTNKCLMEGSL
jgi:hypothetical protein